MFGYISYTCQYEVTRHENIWQIETNLRDRQRFHSFCRIIAYRM